MIFIRRPEGAPEPTVTMEEVTDPKQLAEAWAQREKSDRNWKWYQAHVLEISEANPGKVICISGEEVFSADTVEEAVSRAKTAHPDDNGRFTLSVPREKGVRIYAYRG